MSKVDTILIVKTGALGDVLRTTAILPGLFKRYPGAQVTWVVARDALPLVEGQAGVEGRVLDLDRPGEVLEALSGRRFSFVASLDEEEACCKVASSVEADRFVGAYLNEDGEPVYTEDSSAWFDMSLISRFGKARADELKAENQRTHPALLASALGIEEGRPALSLSPEEEALAAQRWEDEGLNSAGLVIGLNTGAGGRWPSKQLDVARTIETARAISEGAQRELAFLVLGGPEEEERNDEILEGLRGAGLRVASGGCSNTLREFTALVSRCDLVITSDSFCLHAAVARQAPVVAFFAPTSAAEIELYGMGEKVTSTAPDYCSYRAEVESSTITPERLAGAALEVLKQRSEEASG